MTQTVRTDRAAARGRASRFGAAGANRAGGAAQLLNSHPRTIEAILRQTREALGSGSTLESQLLLGQALRRERSWLLAHPETTLTADQLDAFWTAFGRMADGDPLPYLLGEWEFYGRKFLVGPSVLIPRPETELLVEWGLKLARRGGRILDVGTGSGCVAVTLASELPGAQVLGTDRSYAALRVARANADRHTASGRVRLAAADLTAPLAARFDLVCANLPYLPSPRLTGLPVARSEPRLALDGGRDGLQLIRRALRDLPRLLAPHAVALFEIDSGQELAVRRLAASALPDSSIHCVPDLGGLPRLIVIENA